MAQVVAHQAEIEAARARVVTVSFGTPYWSQVWLEETNSPFPFLIDGERAAYQAYGLKSSVIRSWSPSSLIYYARAKLEKREIYGKRGDPHQLGGDFIVDRHGIVRMARPSKESTDRPTMEEIMGSLEQCDP